MGLKKQSGILLARYLIEPRDNTQEIAYNDNCKATQGEVLKGLQEVIEEYKLFEEGAGEETSYSVSER